ncbi:MAG: hypothetical protein KAS32_08485, partial [Candidatus Peribacteraceae bacterium]|nr:hypothetical protein [Candidatus Peribacteraceae bacterium]
MKRLQEWVGFDLDRTLAVYETGQMGIGKAIPSMIAKVQEYLDKGVIVKIFTARAYWPEEIPKIQQWLIDNGLPALEVTREKDPACRRIYDDIAVQVIPNKGK